MRKYNRIKIVCSSMVLICYIYVANGAEIDSKSEAQWLKSDQAIVKKQPVKTTPIIKPAESKFTGDNIPESEKYLSDSEIAKLEREKLMNKFFYNAPNKKYFPRITTNLKIGYPRHILRPQLLVPLNQKPMMLTYFNFITMIDTVVNFEINSALGFRKLEDYFIVGGYVFHDYRVTTNSNKINQITLGAEYLCEDREARVNIYIPFKKKFLISTEHYTEAKFVGSQTVVTNMGDSRYEVVRPGFDIEVGGNISKNRNISFYFKPFFFYHSDFNNIFGLSIRGSFKLNYLASFDTEFTYDNERKFAGFAGITFSWLFGGKQLSKLTYLESKMTQMPIRDLDAVTTVNTKNNQIFSSQVFDKHIAVIDRHPKSSGDAAFSTMNQLNHGANSINDVLIIDGNGFKGVANMTNAELENIELRTLGQLKYNIGGDIFNCVNDKDEKRPEFLRLTENINADLEASRIREAIQRKIDERRRQARQTLRKEIAALQEALSKL